MRASGLELYRALRSVPLGGGTANVNQLVLRRDGVEMTFDGTFYFAAPVEGRILGAVFLGHGSFRATVPPQSREAANVKRLLNADDVASDFRTAVLRFTDDTLDVIGKNRAPDPAPPREATKRWAALEPDLLGETGLNLSSRMLLSLLHQEHPGLFVGQFDKGKRGRFTFLFDPQGRLPTTHFGINAGEKGLVFNFYSGGFNEVWLAFHSLADYQRGWAEFSDHFDLVDVPHYKMTVDVSDFRKPLKVDATLSLVSRLDNLRAISFDLNFLTIQQGLIPDKKKWMRVKSVSLLDGTPVGVLQEPSEVGFTALLPAARTHDERFAIRVELEGDYSYNPTSTTLFEYFPVSNEGWYPRHGGVLSRST